tara:strand:+ start:2148 stop:2729 length:582 start_codon:yes stop_codon:yes gene_type:complete
MNALNQRIITLLIITCVYTFFAVNLVYKEDGYKSAILQALFVFFWSYLGHVSAHYVSQNYPMNIINTHISIHHMETNLPRWLDLTSEGLNNFIGFFVLYIFQEVSGYTFLNLKIILYAAFLYIGVHIFYYSIAHTRYHEVHHEDEFVNFSPEILDYLFNTRKYNANYEKLSVFYETFPAVLSYYAVKQIFKKH